MAAKTAEIRLNDARCPVTSKHYTAAHQESPDKRSVPHLCKAGSFVGAEEGPVCIGLHALHEQVADPQGVEQVPRPGLQACTPSSACTQICNCMLAMEGWDTRVPKGGSAAYHSPVWCQPDAWAAAPA